MFAWGLGGPRRAGGQHRAVGSQRKKARLFCIPSLTSALTRQEGYFLVPTEVLPRNPTPEKKDIWAFKIAGLSRRPCGLEAPHPIRRRLYLQFVPELWPLKPG